MADIEIEIDGRKLAVPQGQTIIEAADAAGIYIPGFCYHKHLSVAANCRMCLVEVEKSPKTLPACATPVMPGMKVATRSQKTIEAQRAVMEFLLINHPLDCPICDQGGECELQDLAMGYGASQSKYDECKRSVADEDLGPLIATEMTRCILCTRCVRYGTEVAGVRELGVINRGGHAEIHTFIEQTVTSEVSGNIIDLCPVGALTSKPFRFRARAWELDQAPSISPHDCLGSNVNVHRRYGTVMRVVPRENIAINETWLSDRDRFSYAGLYHADRLKEPRAKMNGRWETVSWEKALELAAKGLQEVVQQAGADKLGALASPSSTTEELYLLQKLTRALGSQHVDHRLREIDTSDTHQIGAFPGLGMSIADIEKCDAIVLIGSHLQKEQPLAATRIRKAVKKGAQVFAINPVDYDFNFAVAGKVICAPHEMIAALEDVANGEIAQQLKDKQRVLVLLGAIAMHHPDAASLRALAAKLAKACNGTLGMMTDGANGAGAWLAGAVPQQSGLSAYDMLKNPREAYLLLNVEPELDCANAQEATAALEQAKFVVALSLYRNETLEQHADIILPMAPFTETAGTFVNAAGEWQSFEGVAKPYGTSRPAWKILRALANFMQLDGFEYESAPEIRDAIPRLASKVYVNASEMGSVRRERDGTLSRIGEIPLYAIDSLTRHSQPLQEAQMLMLGDVDFARLHPETAARLKLTEGAIACIRQDTAEVKLLVVLDTTIARDAVWIAGGIAATAALGDLFGEVNIM
jgi:NADH-quinone oxidoreductase subunit G